ncbi:hypothetical protein [Pseudoscardovia radai]|nr:hypothetical protein [Pseudoscardovia radai]
MEWKALRDANSDAAARDVLAEWMSDSYCGFGSETLRLLAGNGIDDFEDIRPLISGYAATNGHELVAEAFVDVLYNVDNASPLSVAVVREKIDRRAVGG